MTPISAFANSLPEYTDLSKTDVLDDLTSSTVNGEPFNLANYPYGIAKNPELLTFVEYCYSYDPAKQNNYGLYVYVYNPSGKIISDETNANHTIQMAITSETGAVLGYHKFSLEYIDHVESGDYKNLFYKFRVVDEAVYHSLLGYTTFLDRVNSNGRKYEIIDIEILYDGYISKSSIKVGETFVFKGYASGLGPDETAICSLQCEASSTDVIELSVNHTYYRTKRSDLENHQNQLETVYFSIPKSYLDEYGSLQRIKAEWFEYKTQPIIVTDNGNFYNAVAPYVGSYMPDQHSTAVASDGKSYGAFVGDHREMQAGVINDVKVSWNLGDKVGTSDDTWNYLFYLFLAENIKSYDPKSDVTANGGVTSNALYDYIKNYNGNVSGNRLDIKGGTISADLFISGIDSNRYYNDGPNVIQMGRCTYDFDADVDIQELKNWSQYDLSFKDAWDKYGFWQALTGNRTENLDKSFAPIQILTAADLTGTNEAISNNLAVNIQDVDKIKTAYNNASTNDEVLVLFRFAVTDYYSEPLWIVEFGGTLTYYSNQHAYIAQETVFLDFDIIQLSFKKDEVWTIIPVVMDPMDIIADVTPPTDMPKDWADLKKELEDWLEKLKEIAKKVIAVVLICMLVVVVIPILTPILKLLLHILSLPLRLLFERRRKR